MSRRKGRGTTPTPAQQRQTAQQRHQRPSRPGRPAEATPAATVGPPPPADSGAPALSRRYVDVGVVRIQEWLARTPDLRFRRGASVLLSRETSRAVHEPALPDGVVWNEEAGDLDGVVSLTVTAVPDRIEAAVLDAAQRTARRLRRSLPYCAVEAVSAAAPSYVEAYPELARRRARGDLVLVSLPPPAETVVGKPCDQCRAAAAVCPDVVVHADEGPVDLCADCDARHWHAGGTRSGRGGPHVPGDPWSTPRPELRAIEALNARYRAAGIPLAVRDLQDDFQQLAAGDAPPARASERSTTQLALIYADGNAVGGFLTTAASRNGRDGWPLKNRIVPALDNATVDALAAAAATTLPGGDRPRLLVHLAGGDDVLVSVPANQGWAFTRALMEVFPAALADALTAGLSDRQRREITAAVPSLSVGLVFHHYSQPFSDVVAVAARELKHAKRHTGGKQASVAFVDLTADGYQAQPGRPAVTATELTRQAPLYDRLAAVPVSQRATFLTLTRQHQTLQDQDATRRAEGHVRRLPIPGDTAGDEHPETPLQTLSRRVLDLDQGVLAQIVTALPAPTPAELRDAFTHDEGAARLRQALDVARWWPRPERDRIR